MAQQYDTYLLEQLVVQQKYQLKTMRRLSVYTALIAGIAAGTVLAPVLVLFLM